MTDRDTIVIVDEEYNISNTEEKVQGCSVIIDGPLKRVLDKMLCNNQQFASYSELIKEAIYLGLIEIINLEMNQSYQDETHSEILNELNKTEYEEIPFEEFEYLTSKIREKNIEDNLFGDS